MAVFLAICCSIPGAFAETPGGNLASERPDPKGTPTKVELALYLLDLSEVDDLRQDFSVDLYLRVQWGDARLATDEAEAAVVRTFPLSEVWNPEIGALNRRSVAFLLPQTVKVDSGGNVQYDQRIQGEFASPLDLREFPADQQALAIRLASYRYGPDELEIVINRDKTGRLEELSVAGWDVGQPEVEAAPLVVPGGIPRAGVIYKLAAKRQTTYYVLTMVIPLLLIALMAWSVFWIDPSFLPSQIGVSTASVFSLIAFRLGLASSLPKVAYLTRADEFVLAITILVFAAFGEAVLTGSLFKAGREELARSVDRWARWLYLGALAMVGLVLM
jgi:hypothetical protein